MASIQPENTTEKTAHEHEQLDQLKQILRHAIAIESSDDDTNATRAVKPGFGPAKKRAQADTNQQKN